MNFKAKTRKTDLDSKNSVWKNTLFLFKTVPERTFCHWNAACWYVVRLSHGPGPGTTPCLRSGNANAMSNNSPVRAVAGWAWNGTSHYQPNQRTVVIKQLWQDPRTGTASATCGCTSATSSSSPGEFERAQRCLSVWVAICTERLNFLEKPEERASMRNRIN